MCNCAKSHLHLKWSIVLWQGSNSWIMSQAKGRILESCHSTCAIPAFRNPWKSFSSSLVESRLHAKCKSSLCSWRFICATGLWNYRELHPYLWGPEIRVWLMDTVTLWITLAETDALEETINDCMHSRRAIPIPQSWNENISAWQRWSHEWFGWHLH